MTDFTDSERLEMDTLIARRAELEEVLEILDAQADEVRDSLRIIETRIDQILNPNEARGFEKAEWC